MIEILYYILFSIVLTAIAWLDIRTMKIKNFMIYFLLIFGIAGFFMIPKMQEDIGLHIAGIFFVSIPMLILTKICGNVFGGGDIKLAAAMGLILGWKSILEVVVIALLFSGIYSSILLIRRKRKSKDRFAFAPFLCFGVFCVWIENFIIV